MNNRIADCRKRKIDRDFFSKPADSIKERKRRKEAKNERDR